ncbi:MAG: insulinase family protein [Acidimicrobiia bacterium]|nr:insulinase family protein [Acidimicrobiia bacterium]
MKRRMQVLTLAFAGLALAQEGQELTSLKGVVLKGKAPVSNEILRVKLPKAAEGKLKNGLTVLVMEDHRTPLVFMDVVIPASSLSDPADLPGLADATADMIRLGTKTRTARQIAEQLAGIGASLSAQAGFGSRTTHVRMSMLAENLEPSLALAADVLLNPSFPQDELDNWKSRQLTALQQMRTQPSFLADQEMMKILYAGDARSVIASTPAAVRKLTRENLADFYQGRYTPAGAVLGVSGDVTLKQLLPALEKYLGGWKGPGVETPKLPVREPIGKRSVTLIHRPNSVQTYLLVANRAIDRLSPDYYSCTVLNRVLGQGPASRLFRNIREEKGYTYGIRSSFSATRYRNHFEAATSVRTEVTGPALEELLKEFFEIAAKPVPPEELNGAKRALVANFALGLESSSSLLGQVLMQREYGFPADYWDRYPENIMKITAEDVARAGSAYVPRENAQIVAVGDAGKIRDVLKKFGEVREISEE